MLGAWTTLFRQIFKVGDFLLWHQGSGLLAGEHLQIRDRDGLHGLVAVSGFAPKWTVLLNKNAQTGLLHALVFRSAKAAPVPGLARMQKDTPNRTTLPF